MMLTRSMCGPRGRRARSSFAPCACQQCALRQNHLPTAPTMRVCVQCALRVGTKFRCKRIGCDFRSRARRRANVCRLLLSGNARLHFLNGLLNGNLFGCFIHDLRFQLFYQGDGICETYARVSAHQPFSHRSAARSLAAGGGEGGGCAGAGGFAAGGSPANARRASSRVCA